MSHNLLDGRSLSRPYVRPAPSRQALSRYWRTMRASHEATELALVLRALRKVTGHIGLNVRPVFWLGMTSSPGSAIIVDPQDYAGSYPMPLRTFDVMVGHVVREAYHDLEWSQWVKNRVQGRFKTSHPEAADYLISVLAAGEDIFINRLLASRSVWSLYLTRYWEHSLAKRDRDPSLPPTPSSLADVWRAVAVTASLPEGLHEAYGDLLTALGEHQDALREVGCMDTVLQRSSARVMLYEKIWNRLAPRVLEMIGSSIPLSGVEIRQPGAPRKASQDSERPVHENIGLPEEERRRRPGLEKEVAEQVSTLLDGTATDLSDWIASVAQDAGADAIPTVLSAGSAPSTVTPDPHLVKRLRRVFEAQEAFERRFRKKRVRRGMCGGRLDARRLYRWSLDEKIFKITDKLNPDHAWQITLLVDASASMVRKKRGEVPWTVAEKTLTSLVEAGKASRNKLEVYAYNEQDRRCQVVSLADGEKVFTLCPAGQTPSGQALLTVALLGRGRPNKTLILHITDGGCNCGLDVAYATRYCRENDIDLITIGCGYTAQTSDLLREQYRGSLCLMDSIYLLPENLERVIRQRLLA
ncbi:MAG: VWA domain-containing protein [Desulfomonile tiedjei]|nr:VWA domain-containing protein [Desulfomonile tiedjei]